MNGEDFYRNVLEAVAFSPSGNSRTENFKINRRIKCSQAWMEILNACVDDKYNSTNSIEVPLNIVSAVNEDSSLVKSFITMEKEGLADAKLLRKKGYEPRSIAEAQFYIGIAAAKRYLFLSDYQNRTINTLKDWYNNGFKAAKKFYQAKEKKASRECFLFTKDSIDEALNLIYSRNGLKSTVNVDFWSSKAKELKPYLKKA